jgi:hypothetical protein
VTKLLCAEISIKKAEQSEARSKASRQNQNQRLFDEMLRFPQPFLAKLQKTTFWSLHPQGLTSFLLKKNGVRFRQIGIYRQFIFYHQLFMLFIIIDNHDKTLIFLPMVHPSCTTTF